MREPYFLCVEEGLMSPMVERRLAQHFGGFFHQLIVCQLIIGRKDSIQELGDKIDFCIARQLFKIQDQFLKYSGGWPNQTTLRSS
jgi:hypothetical protein